MRLLVLGLALPFLAQACIPMKDTSGRGIPATCSTSATAECRSCTEILVKSALNCPGSGYDCDEKEVISATVLSPSDPCTCQSISCASKGWNLAVNGAIVEKLRCEGRKWVTPAGLPASSGVCAKESVAPVCNVPPADFPCDLTVRDPSLSATCVDGLQLGCSQSNSVLVALSPDVPENVDFTAFTTLEGPSACDAAGKWYTASSLGKNYEISQVNCAVCPYMSGDASTTYAGDHAPAVFKTCIVRCNSGSLYGKTATGFVEVARGVAYYALPAPGETFPGTGDHFIDSATHIFAPDFYCVPTTSG